MLHERDLRQTWPGVQREFIVDYCRWALLFPGFAALAWPAKP
jgi:hypothetical protein